MTSPTTGSGSFQGGHRGEHPWHGSSSLGSGGARWRGVETVKPIIGISPDITEPKLGSERAICGHGYAQAIAAAGGYPVILPPLLELIPQHLLRCDGIVLTGGDDPKMELFGEVTHLKATPMHPSRQTFDAALIRALLLKPEVPVLGVCLGMQMMALCAGGKLNQYLPDTLPSAQKHQGNNEHGVVPVGQTKLIAEGQVTSYHKQAVSDPGTLRVIALSDDGVIEGIDRPESGFFVGVQWHPERTAARALGIGLFEQLVRAATHRRDERKEA